MRLEDGGVDRTPAVHVRSSARVSRNKESLFLRMVVAMCRRILKP